MSAAARLVLVSAFLPLVLAVAPARAEGPPAAPAAAASPERPAEAGIIDRLREPLHDIELHSRVVLAKGHTPDGFLPFLRQYADLRDHLDTLVYKGDYAGAVTTARKDLADVQAIATQASLHDFDPELARCKAILAAPEPPRDER